MNTQDTLHVLVDALSSLSEVTAIGLSGGRALPAAGEGDIDLFIYGHHIPSSDERRAALMGVGDVLDAIKIQVFESQHWDVADFVSINGVETWLMFFTESDVEAEIESLLRGEHPEREGDYYPVGRCAMLSTIGILYDREGFLSSLKSRLATYPPALARTLAAYHLGRLADTEDFERAVRRKDALFYHYALDMALDHFLQALFALNQCYFPSRKRSLQYIVGFSRVPAACEERLLRVLARGGHRDGIVESYAIWRGLLDELTDLNELGSGEPAPGAAEKSG